MRGDLLPAAGSHGALAGSAPPLFGVDCDRDACSALAAADHRIANHLASLNGYLRLKAADLCAQTAEPSRESVRLLLEGACAQIGAVARQHRSLASDGQGGSRELSGPLHEVCAPFASGFSEELQLVEDFRPGCIVGEGQVLPLVQIVAEVVANAARHAHPDGEAGFIRVRCRKDDAGAVLVEVSDDGVGLPETLDPRTGGGLGFRLLRALGKQLGAVTEFKSTRQGLHFQLTLPATRPRS